MKKGITLIAVLAAVLAVTSGAFAANHYLISSSSQIKNGAISLSDLSPAARKALKGQQGWKGDTGAAGPQGHAGAQGPKGDKGDSGLTGAFYATAFYNAGNTNAGAIASVACYAEKTDYIAISGGVQVLGLGEGANTRNTPVSSSFPGRMDWTAGAPKPDRLDGWIVQFGGNAGATSDKAPRRSRSGRFACPVPAFPVNQTFQQVD